MNISPNNEKIQKYLDELSEEYKELLFKALLERSKSIDDISISELLRLDNEIKKPLLMDYQRQQRRRRLFITAGLTYILLGFCMFFFYSIVESDLIFSTNRMIPLMSLVICLVGVCVVAFSFILPTTKAEVHRSSNNSKSETTKLLAYSVITQWRELEGIVNDLAESNNVSTPRSIIEYLLTNNLIDKDESNILKDFLKMRNSIVHSSDFRFSSNEIKEISDKVSIIISKLKKIL